MYKSRVTSKITPFCPRSREKPTGPVLAVIPIIQSTMITPVNDFKVAIEGGAKHYGLAIDVLSCDRISVAVLYYQLTDFGPRIGRFANAIHLSHAAGGIGADELKIAMGGTVAALIHVAIMVALSGPRVWVNVGDSILGTAIDSRSPVSTSK